MSNRIKETAPENESNAIDETNGFNFNLGSTIANFREEKDMTLFELARKMGVSPGYLSKIENNRSRLNMEILASICKSLEIPIQVLIIDGVLNQSSTNPKADEIRSVLKPVITHLVKRILNDDELHFDGVLNVAIRDMLPAS